jgi:hypothetical protein
MSTYNWIDGKWPKDKSVCHFTAGRGGIFRGEVYSSGDGYDIKIRYDGIMVCSDRLGYRGEGSLSLAIEMTERMFEKIKLDING